MIFKHQTVKHLLNLVVRQYVMSQKQSLLSSKLRACMCVSVYIVRHTCRFTSKYYIY